MTQLTDFISLYGIKGIQYYKDFRGSRLLWKEVVHRIVLDAAKRPRSKAEHEYRRDALNWIFSAEEEEDFQTVCFRANYSPEKIRAKVLRTIKNQNVSQGRILDKVK